MGSEGYLQWLARETRTCWWHDSAEPMEVDRAIGRGAVGATTNPLLSNLAVLGQRERWGPHIDEVLVRGLDGERT